MIGYWDPMPTARRLIDGLDKPTERLFTGRWEERNWRNVPGPFYASETDSLQIGRLAAPDHVCYDDDIGNGFGYEFIYRQPVNVPETEAEWKAAGSSCTAVATGMVATIGRWGRAGVVAQPRPGAGVGSCDGRRLGSGHASALGLQRRPQISGPLSRCRPRAHRDFVAYLDDGLEAYLRGFLFWLDQRREPRAHEPLPDL